MNKLVISTPINSYDVSGDQHYIIVVNSELSADEFKKLFTKSVEQFIVEMSNFELEKDVAMTASVKQHETNGPRSKPYKNAVKELEFRLKAIQDFGRDNDFFEHNGTKISKSFFYDPQGLIEFSVLSLEDWFESKKAAGNTIYSRFAD